MKRFRSYKKLSDEDLMSLISAGNKSGLKEIYDRYSNKILFYFYRMFAGDEEKAQDLLQDVFLKIVEKPNLFNPELKFSTWIFSIASNLCKNEYRRLKVREVMDIEPDLDNHAYNQLDQGKNLDNGIIEAAIQRELGHLDPDQSNTFILRYQENLSIREIGKILDCSPGTVKSRLFYTTRKLASRLSEYNPYYSEDKSDEK